MVDMSKQRPRPHSTLGIERGSPTGSNSSDSEDQREPAWLHGPDWTRHASQASDESELQSPLPGDGFSRDGFGRQSMSEKRKGHNDPRSSEIYQKVKGLKELNKAGIRGPGPPSNLKRFSSLENLTTMQDHDGDTSNSFTDDDASHPPRMARKRGGNESFRAAVDRSYDPVPHQPEMDPQRGGAEEPSGMRRSRSVEEESSEGGSVSRVPLISARSSVSDQVAKDEHGHKGKKDGKKMKENRKSGGGILGFLFNKGRKTPVEDLGKGGHTKAEDSPREIIDSQDGHGDSDLRRLLPNQQMLDQQRQYHHQQQQQYPGHGYTVYPYNPPPPEPHGMGHSAPTLGYKHLGKEGEGMTRAEKIQQLRLDHQRRHMERHGHYPQEEREEEYERMIQEEELRGLRYNGDDYFLQKYGQSAIPSQNDNHGQRSRPQSRNQVERPTSRVGPSEGNLHNYQDYNEIPRQNPRHVSDSHLPNYPFMRPSSRGPVPVIDPSHYPQSAGPFRGQGVMFTQHQQGLPRGPTPSHEQEGFVKYNSTSNANANNYTQYGQRGQPAPNVNEFFGPIAPNMNDTRYYGDDTQMQLRAINKQGYNSRDHNLMQRQQEVVPPSGNHYGNATMAYRDPVYTAMAGKRPVKSLSSQPTSAKV